MNCVEICERLPALLYADLAANEAAAVQQHLAGCEVCRREYEALASEYFEDNLLRQDYLITRATKT